MSIAILVPTKGRAKLCSRMIDSVAKTSDSHISIHLGTQGEQYNIPLPRHNFGIKEMRVPDGAPTAHTWNWLSGFPDAQQADLVMLGSDDMVFSTPLWDTALLDHYNALENKIHVYALRDSRDENGTPHIIVTREYIEAMGYFVPPIFLHWFIDSWTVRIAKYCDVFTHMKDYLLIHEKPSDQGKPDATHTGIREMGWHERDKWVAERCENWLIQEQARLRRIIQQKKDVAA